MPKRFVNNVFIGGKQSISGHPVIMCLSGKQGSGKSEVAKCLRKYGFDILVLSEIARDLAPSESANLHSLIEQMMNRQGEDILARLALERISDTGGDIAIVAKSKVDFEYLKGKLPDMSTLYIEAPPNLRQDRVLSRSVKRNRPRTGADFTRKETNETELGIEFILKNADCVIENTETKEELCEAASRFLNEFAHTRSS